VTNAGKVSPQAHLAAGLVSYKPPHSIERMELPLGDESGKSAAPRCASGPLGCTDPSRTL